MLFENGLNYFDLKNAGDSAVVRLLHSSTSKIEGKDLHWIELTGGKKKCVNCVGLGCPVCLQGNQSINRIFIHLIDYTDGLEKVWSRTDKIIPQLAEIEKNWGDLSNCVIKITRDKQDFPTYSVTIMPSNNYPPIDRNNVDVNVAYRCYNTRSRDELLQYVSTGILPNHVKANPNTQQPFAPKLQNNFVQGQPVYNNTQQFLQPVQSTPAPFAAPFSVPFNQTKQEYYSVNQQPLPVAQPQYQYNPVTDPFAPINKV